MKNKVLKPLLYLMTIAIPFFVAGQASAQNVAWDYTDIVYGTDDPARQFLNIYLADTAEPAPVYFLAHQNSKTAYDVSQTAADTIHGEGYTLVSWESVPDLSSQPEDVLTAWSDAQLAFDWVRANAATYNIDPDRIVIAGRSRGSVASWPLAHSGHAAIQGIYVYNALPNPVWAQPEVWSPVDNVNTDSPSIYMVYGPTPGDGDSHAPENAYPIRDAYISFGIGDTFTTYDSMQANGLSANHYFPEFLESIAPSGPPANLTDNFDGGNTTYPWTENGTWYISGGTYNQDDNTGNTTAYAGNSAWTDYTFKADMVTINSANPSTGWMASSLAFRVTDTDNLYFVRLHNNGDLRLFSIVDGTNSLITSVPTAYAPTTWHTYTIVVSGNSIKISINDEMLIDVTDTDHGAGYIGVRTNQNGVSVNNVAVTQPPGC